MSSRTPLVPVLLAFALSASSPAQTPVPEVLTSLPRGAADLKGIQARVQLALEAARDCTVGVGGGGSGVIVSPDGLVMTAAHVGVRAGRTIALTFRDGRRAQGVTLGNFHGVDAGLARITDEGPWPFAERASSGTLQPGDWCFALGFPATFERDKDPPLRLGRIVFASPTRLSTDCMIMGGDSGGPLFDLDGRVIGIHSSAGGRTGNNHVPSDVYTEHWERMLQGEDWGNQRGDGGFRGVAPKFGIQRDRDVEDGVGIAEVVPDSPAAELGLQKGDVIVSVNGSPIRTYARLVGALRMAGEDGQVTLEVRRGDRTLTLVAAGEPEDERMPNAPQPEDESTREERAGAFRGRFRTSPETQRDQEPLLDTLRDVVSAARRATIRLSVDGEERALATVVNVEAGVAHAFAPASALADGALRARAANDESVDARILARHDGLDLALVELRSEAVAAAPFAPRPAPQGAILLSVGPAERPVGFGIVSTEAREMRDASRFQAPLPVYFGATLQDAPSGGIRIDSLVDDGPMQRAGFQAEDVIRSIGGVEVRSRGDLPKAVGERRPGDEVELVVVRAGAEVTQRLAFGRPPGGRGGRRGGAQNTLDRWGGGPFSAKRAGFDAVWTVDTYLAPEHCGGPVVDLDGRIAGMHLSRALRVTTYTIPAHTLLSVYATLVAERAATEATEAATAVATESAGKTEGGGD